MITTTKIKTQQIKWMLFYLAAGLMQDLEGFLVLLAWEQRHSCEFSAAKSNSATSYNIERKKKIGGVSS